MPRGGRDRRHRDAEPRHARRQHRQRVARRRHAAGAAGLRRRARAGLGRAASRRVAVRRFPYRLQADGSGARRAVAVDPAAARPRRVRCTYYRKVGTRRAQAISKVCFARQSTCRGTAVRDIRIAFGSVAPTVVRAAPRRSRDPRSRIDAETIAASCGALSATSRRSTIYGRPLSTDSRGAQPTGGGSYVSGC